MDALIVLLAELVYDNTAERLSELETGAENDMRVVLEPVEEETGDEVVVIVPTLTV